MLERLRKGPEEDELLAQLSPQERNILNLITDGLTNRQIAEQIQLAEKTVKNYFSNLLTKLGMERRSQAAVYAARLSEQRGERAAEWPSQLGSKRPSVPGARDLRLGTPPSISRRMRRCRPNPGSREEVSVERAR